MRIAEFQRTATGWALMCFGKVVVESREERADRVLEETLELMQAAGMAKERVLQLVEYVYNRPVGELPQEVGGTLVTLAAFCSAHGLKMEDLARDELVRCMSKTSQIRAKHLLKRQAGVSMGLGESAEAQEGMRVQPAG